MGLPPTQITVGPPPSSGGHHHKKSTNSHPKRTHGTHHKKSNTYHVAATDTTPGYTVTIEPDGTVVTKLTTKGPRKPKGHKVKHDPGTHGALGPPRHHHKWSNPTTGPHKEKKDKNPKTGRKPKKPKGSGTTHRGKGHSHISGLLLGTTTPLYHPTPITAIPPATITHSPTGAHNRHTGTPHHFNPSSGFL